MCLLDARNFDVAGIGRLDATAAARRIPATYPAAVLAAVCLRSLGRTEPLSPVPRLGVGGVFRAMVPGIAIDASAC